LPAARETSGSQRREKNSNAIKKIGRIILDNLREYSSIRNNSAVTAMLKLLSKDSKVGRNEVNKRDKFNTFHLRLLLSGRDAELVRANLRVTRRILARHLRHNVLQSRQITPAHKAIYLNTMKCSALRCLHQGLAVRLQMSQ
jgi:flagellar motor component MotA